VPDTQSDAIAQQQRALTIRQYRGYDAIDTDLARDFERAALCKREDLLTPDCTTSAKNSHSAPWGLFRGRIFERHFALNGAARRATLSHV
jgi:hypothetical protein